MATGFSYGTAILVLPILTLLATSPASTAAPASLPSTQPSRDAADVAVMTLNIRNSNAEDGANDWEFRQPIVLKCIQEFAPDLLGTQEVRPIQLAFLDEHLHRDFHVVPGRTGDATDTGERMAIFARKSRFEVIETGQLWLSETPEVPGSRGWDARLPRTMTWARLLDLRRPKQSVLFVNTHFDHIGAEARLHSAALMRRWLDEHAGDSAVIVTGDFNAPQDSPAYETLVSAPKKGVVLADAYRQVKKASRAPEVGTFHGFRGVPGAHRIDWILASAEFTAVASDNDFRHEGSLYPSDHFPVWAVFRIGAKRP